MILQTRSSRRFFIIFTIVALFLFPALLAAQTAAPSQPAASAQPPDVSPAWKSIVGIYEYGSAKPKQTVVILERNLALFLRWPNGKEVNISFDGHRLDIPEKGGKIWSYGLVSEPGEPLRFSYLTEQFTRSDAGSDPSHFFHVTPPRPLSLLRAEALAAHPPKEAGPFRQPDLVELVTLDPAIHLDIRYAQSNNFLSTPVYTQARAFLQRPAAEALLRALNKLKPLGYGLLIHDAYRPWYVTKIFWDATPPSGRIFVANPQEGSKHNRGSAVDLTLYDLATGAPIEMPGLYDEMSPRSFPDFPGGISLQRWHRDLLRRVMESEGFAVNEDEWWHFDHKDWKRYPILNLPFEKISPSYPAPSA